MYLGRVGIQKDKLGIKSTLNILKHAIPLALIIIVFFSILYVVVAYYLGTQPIYKTKNLLIDSFLFSVVTFFALPYDQSYSTEGIYSIIASIESIFYALFFVTVIQIAINNSNEETKNKKWEPIKNVACSALILESRILSLTVHYILGPESYTYVCSLKSVYENNECNRLITTIEEPVWLEFYKYNSNKCKKCPYTFPNISTRYLMKQMKEDAKYGKTFTKELLESHLKHFNDLQIKYQDFLDLNITIKIIMIQIK